MTGSGWLLAGVGFYLAAILTVGIVTWRKMRSFDDFVLGGRKLSPFTAALSERASGESAWFLLGLPGAAYAAGFSEFWTVIGSAFGVFFSWTLLARLLNAQSRRFGALTLPDYLEARFGDTTRVLRVVSMVIILFFYTAYVGAQFVGAGKILNATFGIDASTGMILGALVVVLYTFMGGFLAVVWTDVFQGLLMMLVVVILPVMGIFELGGLTGFVDAVGAKGPEFLTMSGGQTGRALLFGVMIGSLSWGFGYLGQPHLLTRYMAIRHEDEVRQGHTVAMSWVLLSYWGAVFVGLVAIGILPDVADTEQVMPLLAMRLLPAWFAGLAIAGGIAAMMSTADSQLLVATSALVEDIYARILRPGASQRVLLLLSRGATVVIALVALLLAFRNQDLIFDWVAYAWTGLGSSFGPPLILALRWRGTTRQGVLAGMIGGMVSTVAWRNVELLQATLDLKIATFLISMALVVLVSFATGRGKRGGGIVDPVAEVVE
ncbi:MAG: sodium/proline symporter [Gemmatimonadota bacterium]|jgi:sodium/proline symporter|nr:sodium/proline symporter [Gemmatimonadota bacterium]MDP6802246.1 sodium/proline symporter [Gemmatimonadota bacterium]MDP7032167.1 sodium/proline symporter [Gemmatimonadota bacterium]